MADAPPRHVLLVAPGRLELAVTGGLRPGPDDLVVRPDAVGICGTDLELLDGSMTYLASGFTRYPIVPGHEWSGVVTALGDDVDGFAVGDRVVGECSIGCGRCEWCVGGSYHLCADRTETGIAGRAGALTGCFAFPGRAAHRIPDGVSAADAALIEPLAVAYRGLTRLGVRENEPLGIVGAGTIGLLTALTARALGIEDIRVSEVEPTRRRFASDLGFSVVDTEIAGQVPRVVEASGTADGVRAGLRLCREGGEVVLLGLTGARSVAVDLDGVVARDVTVHGSLGSPSVWPDVIDLVADRRIRPSILVSHEFPLSESAAAFELARSRSPGVRKILIRPGLDSATPAKGGPR